MCLRIYVCNISVAIPATLNMYSVKLTLRIVTAISMVKFIACACVSVFGIYYLIVNGRLYMYNHVHFIVCILQYTYFVTK